MSGQPSLKEIEAAFQTIQFHLSLKISHRIKTRLLGNFCRLLQIRDNPVLNHSYYQELLPHLISYADTENLKFQPIEIIHAYYETLVYIQCNPDAIPSEQSLSASIERVKHQLVSTCIYLSEFRQALLYTVDEVSTLDFKLLLPEEQNSFEDLLTVIENYHPNSKLFERFTRIKREWDASSSGYSNSEVWIPLVENFEDDPGQETVVGTIYPLSLDLEARKTNRHRDLISFNNHPIAQDDLVNYQAQDALRAARNQHNLLKKDKATRFTVMFGFPSTDYFYAGSSFGLGMSLLSLCAFQRETNLRRQYSISKDFAFTGGVDLNGKIRPVNSISLEEKVKAVFFSPLKGLIVPQDNLDVAQKILDPLLEKYPGRHFLLLSEAGIPEILVKREVLIYEKMPVLNWMKNHLTRSKIIQIIILILVAVALTLTTISLLTDLNPSDYKVEGEKVLLFNNEGRFLWDIELGHIPKVLEDDYGKQTIYRRLQINDYDGDGENEVILGTAVKTHEFNGRLYFIETDGQVKWMFSDHPELVFGSNAYSDNYGVGFIYPFKHSGSQAHDIYVRFSHMPWFPNRIVRFNIEGEIQDEFIHPGAIYDMALLDLDKDGKVEMLLAGTNNNFNDAFLAIMPSQGYSGSTPVWGEGRKLQGGTIDSNLVYIKFPHWGKYDVTGTNARTHVNDIHPDSDDGFIVSTVLGGSREIGSYMYHFDHELNLVGLSVSDGFLGQYHKQFGQDFFDRFDRSEWFEAMSKLDIWRKGEWIKP